MNLVQRMLHRHKWIEYDFEGNVVEDGNLRKCWGCGKVQLLIGYGYCGQGDDPSYNWTDEAECRKGYDTGEIYSIPHEKGFVELDKILSSKQSKSAHNGGFVQTIV